MQNGSFTVNMTGQWSERLPAMHRMKIHTLREHDVQKHNANLRLYYFISCDFDRFIFISYYFRFLLIFLISSIFIEIRLLYYSGIVLSTWDCVMSGLRSVYRWMFFWRDTCTFNFVQIRCVARSECSLTRTPVYHCREHSELSWPNIAA